MNAEQRRKFYRRTLLSLWGVGTLVLIFCVAMLVNELAARKDLAVQQAAQTIQPDTPTDTGPRQTRDLDIYFADEFGIELRPERQRIEVSSSQIASIRNIVQRVIEGPLSPELTPILPPETTLRGVYILEGTNRGDAELVLDFSRELEQGLPPSAMAEGLMAYGIVHTLCQPGLARTGEPVITRVRFLFEGAEQERFPQHINLREPLTPNPLWMANTNPPPGGNG